MGCVQFGICREKTLALKAKYGIDDFVETGMLVAHTTVWASGHFARVTTIDIDEQLEARENIFPHRNILFIKGDSTQVLESFTFTNPTLFWLDAHTNEFCPVLREIAIINRSALRHVILVDDVYQFGVLPAWPTKEQAIKALEDNGRRTVHEFEDVFVAEPCP